MFAPLRLIPLWAYAVVALAGWFGYNSYTKTQAVNALQRDRLEQAEGRAAAEATARQKENELGRISSEAAETLRKSSEARTAADRSAADRMRRLAAAWAASSAGAGAQPACGLDGAPAVAILPEQARTDLVQLASEADAVADRLRACQAWAARTQQVLQ